jgi:cytochrome c
MIFKISADHHHHNHVCAASLLISNSLYAILSYLSKPKYPKMKRALAIIAGLAFIVACSNNNNADTKEKTEEPAAPATTEAPATSPETEKGMELIAKSDCLTCHKIVEASVGPAYEVIAAKYPDNDTVVDSLAQKVIKGGSGNWGTVPMTPHPNLPVEDAKAMVKYVLSLK